MTKTYTISELADSFNISTRTIRYYEELGILHPKRSEGGQRVFSKKEKARLQLILRGKKFGFQLDEIKEMVTLFDKDRTGKKQLRKTIDYGNQKIEEVSEQIEELIKLKEELVDIRDAYERKIKELERE